MDALPTDTIVLPPTDDRVFKLLLTREGSEPILKDLLSAILNRPVQSVIVRNNEIPPEGTEEKAERLDVNCRTEDGTQFDLEMQASRIEEEPGDKTFRNLNGKNVYYLCDLHSSQRSKGLRRYGKLAQSWQVTFCTYNVCPDRENPVNTISLRYDEDFVQFSESIHIVYVELCKLRAVLDKPVAEMSDLEKWAIFLRYANTKNPKRRKIVNKIIESKEALKMANDVLLHISKDERERAINRSRRMFQTDLESNLATATLNGEKRGEKNGIIHLGRTLGWSDAQIVDALAAIGVPREEADVYLFNWDAAQHHQTNPK